MRLISLLSAAAVFLAPSAAFPVFLQMATPRVDLLDAKAIVEKCGGPGRLACTTIETRVISSCDATGSAWHPHSVVQIDTHVYTSSATLVTHEFTHVADIRDGVRRKAASIEAHAFDSEAACRDYVLQADAAVPGDIAEMAEESHVRRDAPTVIAQPASVEVDELVAEEDAGDAGH